jgi:hypothetical protein
MFRFRSCSGMGKNPPSSLFCRTRLHQAAKSGMLSVAHCLLCRRTVSHPADETRVVTGRDLPAGRARA